MTSEAYEIRDGLPYVCDRPVSWAHEVICHDHAYEYGYDVRRLYVWRTRGFYLRLENGLLVSTQFGSGNYCENYETTFTVGQAEFTETPVTAEMACGWKSLEKMLEWPESGDPVQGYVPAGCWWELVGVLGRLPTGCELTDHPEIREVLCEETR